MYSQRGHLSWTFIVVLNGRLTLEVKPRIYLFCLKQTGTGQKNTFGTKIHQHHRVKMQSLDHFMRCAQLSFRTTAPRIRPPTLMSDSLLASEPVIQQDHRYLSIYLCKRTGRPCPLPLCFDWTRLNVSLPIGTKGIESKVNGSTGAWRRGRIQPPLCSFSRDRVVPTLLSLSLLLDLSLFLSLSL